MKVLLFALGMLVQLVVGLVSYRLGRIRARRSEVMLADADAVIAKSEAALIAYREAGQQERRMVN